MDIATLVDKPALRPIVQLGFGVACAAGMIALRGLVDLIAPTAGPFALVYPVVLIATLYGHWPAGLSAATISILWAWRYVLPPVGSFHFQVATDSSRVALNVFSVLVVILFAEVFRRAVRTAMHARDREIERVRMLMVELEHRTRNNFMMVASMLNIQRRQLRDPALVAELDRAINRVQTFAEAYSDLAATAQGEGTDVDVAPYLGSVVRRFADGAFDPRTQLDIRIDDMVLPRQTAVAIGLYLNEALTNCAKYAFPQGRSGTVAVHFLAQDKSWSLSVADDGIGKSDVPRARGGGVGSSLMGALAQMARAEHVTDTAGAGWRTTLDGRLA